MYLPLVAALLHPALLIACATATTSRMPTVIGQCSDSTIKTTGSRLQGTSPLESGSIVTFANGGYQTSYEPVDGILESLVGDPVRVCLVSIPEDCPPGDARGRIYDVTNLRTGDSWRLRDDPHICGGA